MSKLDGLGMDARVALEPGVGESISIHHGTGLDARARDAVIGRQSDAWAATRRAINPTTQPGVADGNGEDDGKDESTEREA